MHKFKTLLVAALVTASVGTASAETKEERTMLNASRLGMMLDQVIPEKIPNMLDQISSGRVKRIAPEQPVWVLESIDGTILYYQGQPDFKNKPATALVDDAGVRFGMLGLEAARKSSSRWISVTLSGTEYKAFCHVLNPFVVCSLMV